MLSGCLTIASGQTRNFAENDTGGASTTNGTGGEGPLFDGVGGYQPSCCLQAPPAPFEGPSWFAISGDGSPASCPTLTTEGLKAVAEMKPLAPPTCGECLCSPAACTLPDGIHTNASNCPGNGSITVPFGPGAGWEGVCTEEGGLPANLQCAGEPCAQSVSIPALPIAACNPKAAPSDPFPSPEWARMATECLVESPSEDDCGAGFLCVPSPPDGLSLCLYVAGEFPTCPLDYPAQMVFFAGVDDQRGCSPCACSPQRGAECMAIVSTFSDAACSTLAGAVVVSDQEAACFDLISGTALASAEASLVVDKPGSCTASGGAPFGGLSPIDPLTLCCKSDAEPPG